MVNRYGNKPMKTRGTYVVSSAPKKRPVPPSASSGCGCGKKIKRVSDK